MNDTPRISERSTGRKIHSQNNTVQEPDSLNSSVLAASLKPKQVAREDSHSQRKRSPPSRYLDSENYSFRVVKRGRVSHLTSSSPKPPGRAEMRQPSNHSRSLSRERSPQRSEPYTTLDSDDEDSDGDFEPADDLPVKATKAPSTHDSIIVRFNEAEAEDLLPSPIFPHIEWVKDNYWTLDDEAALQRQYGSWADWLATRSRTLYATCGAHLTKGRTLIWIY